jgi:hypothetical protein
MTAHQRALAHRLVTVLFLAAFALAAHLPVVSSHIAVIEAKDAVAPLVLDGDPIEKLASAAPQASALYAVGAEALHRSTDGGNSWDKTGPRPPAGVLVPAQDDPSFLLSGDHPPCARGDAGDAGSRSTDGGASWSELPDAVGIRPAAAWVGTGLALGISCVGLEVSTDLGSSWTNAWNPGGNGDVSAFALAPSDNQPDHAVLVVVTSEGGTSTLVRLVLSSKGDVRAAAPLHDFWGLGAPAACESLFALGSATGVAVSRDAGKTWSEHKSGLESVTVSVDPSVDIIPESERERGFGINALVIDADQPDSMYAGTANGVFISADGSASWRRLAGIDGPVDVVILTAPSERVYAQGEEQVFVVQ